MKVGSANVLRAVAVFLLLLGVIPAPADAQTAPQNVVALRIVTQDGRVVSQTPPPLPIQLGKPLDNDQVAQSIRLLYRSGDFADIRAVSSPASDGILVDFVVREQLFFNRVVVTGLVSPPSEASAVAAVQLPLGAPYESDVVDQGLDRLRDLLKEEGFYKAQLTVSTVPYPANRQIDMIIHINSGLRSRAGQVQVKNGTEFPDRELLSRLKLKPGQPVTSAKVRSGTERIRKFLVKTGHLNARAIVHRGEYDAAKNSVPLELDVTEGPRVELAVDGIKISKGELKKLVPVYQEGAVDADLLEEGKRNIQERLERGGYFDAKVAYTTSTRDAPTPKGGQAQETEELITYTIHRGDRHKLLRVELAGNRYFDSEQLRSRLQITPAAFLSRGRFSRRLLEADRQSMLNLYLSNGFLQAKVDAEVSDNYQNRVGDLLVRFVVDEGTQTRVASLTIDGVHAFKESELRDVIAATPGEPYSDLIVAKDRDNILATYFDNGFPDAVFTSKAEQAPATVAPNTPPQKSSAKAASAPAGTAIKLTYHVEEGRQIHVRRIMISGYEHTRPGVIRREVRVKPDQPLSEQTVVDSQRRLYNLGIFNRVTIEPQNPNGTDPDKDIVVLVEEAKRYTLAYGGGFEVQRLASTTNPAGSEIQAAVRGILEISKLNLTGRGDSLSLKLRGSTIEDRALLAYQAPHPFTDPHLLLQVTAYTEKTQDINTFTETRYEGSVQLTDQYTNKSSLTYRYTFRKVLVSNLEIPPQEVPLFSAPTLVSQFGVTWVRDARDNPADASKGSFNSAEFAIADSDIGSSASFMRVVLQNATHHPLKRNLNFARSIRFGILEPYHDTVSLAFPAPSVAPFPTLIPLPERFFAGGGESLRGFALNQAGPRDSITGFPVGGQALLVLNQELRFPMKLPFFGTSLGGALFYDGGNVYSRLSRMTFRTYSPTPIFDPSNPKECLYNCTNELNYFSHTVGLGFRYATPVGPIRIDLGYQLNRPRFVIPICPNGAVSCAEGQQGFQGTRLPGFQIFFNLGSSF
jgi:outer membrane protein assembly complex protein YaeT